MSRDTVIDMPVELTSIQVATSAPENNAKSISVDSLLVTPDFTPSTLLRKPGGIVLLTVGAEAAQAEHISSSGNGGNSRAKPARWKTPEFIFYAVVFVIVVPMMVLGPVRLSESSHPNYSLYARRLSPGWIFGRKIDNSDTQYRSFRNNIPALALLSGFFFLLRFFYDRGAFPSSQPNSQTQPQPQSLLYRVPFLMVFSTAMLFILHGTSTLKIFAILGANYVVAKALGPRKVAPVATWVFNVGILFAVARNDGYRFGDLVQELKWLDTMQGVYPRWYISFNITMLRLISFNMDYYLALRAGTRAYTVIVDAPATHKQRTSTPHSLELYSFPNFMAYALYSPLYIAGPIMTFNDFVWQLKSPVSLPHSTVLRYFLRFLTTFLVMELVLHYMYVVAIKDTHAWMGDSPFELSMVGFWNLIIVWLKLLLPWRFFRLWALADGIEPPENMIRCMANNYSTLGFWRSWHRSFNFWIIRYIYVPLGGTRNRIVTSVLVFSFVALWHDLTMRLLAWGWLVSLFILPEVGARALVPYSKFGEKWWYRHVAAMGCVVNILMMMSANLVGFAIGVDGMKYMWAQLSGSMEGLLFLVFSCACLFVAVQVMFEYREEELRQGISRKC